MSKQLLRECLAEYDAVVAAGKAHHLHRVSRRLFDQATLCREELNVYVQSAGSALEEYYTAYSMLQEYAL
eukprot:5812137-Heterocapsa_arctica.AAC.1